MCILSFIPADVPVDNEAIDQLWNGGRNNPDGHGWAIASDSGEMLVGKSLRLDIALAEFAEMRERYTGPALFHSRWATHGSIRHDNCHPFYVGNSDKTVLAHNGILPNSAHPGKGDDRSDTAIMAAEIMPRQFRRLDKPSVRRALRNYCGNRNKLVILSVDNKYRRNFYIVNEAAGQWDTTTGIWHSNSDYLYVVGEYATTTTTETDYSDPTVCDLCNGPVGEYDVCSWCGSCQDCYEHSADCLCFVPDELRRHMT